MICARLRASAASQSYGADATIPAAAARAVTTARLDRGRPRTARRRFRSPSHARQANLCEGLVALGERELGTARLEEAVTACRLALQELTRGRVPLDWAQTQTLLGNALASLGGRHGNTEQLEEAVADYRPALQEQTRERCHSTGRNRR